MAKQLALSILIEMPPDPFDAAEVYAKLKQPWCELLTSLKQSGVVHSIKQDEMETRAKPRPRRPRIVPTPEQAA